MALLATTLWLMALPGVVSWPLSFEKAADMARLRDGGLKAFERVQRHASDGHWSLHVIFPGSPRDTWPGFWLVLEGEKISPKTALVFDVFNPADHSTSVSWRIDDAEGHKVFGSRSLPKSSLTHVQIFFGSLRYQLNLDRLRGIYIYARKPRQDRELFFDNFRIEKVASQFRPITHVPERKPSHAGGEPLIVFHRPWMVHVFADDWPAEDERIDEISIAAARGEYEPLTLSVAASAELKSLRAVLSDLKGPGLLSADHIDLRVVRSLNKRWTYHDAQRRYIANLPVVLEPLPSEGITVPAGQVVRLWLTVHVPPRQRPGVYQGTVTLQAAANGQPVQHTVRIRLRVYPFALPEPRDMFWGVYYTGPTNFEPGQELDKLARHLQDMRDHGMTSVGLCFGWELAQTDISAHRVNFLPPGRGRWETFMELYKKLGFPAPVIQLSDTPQAAVFSQMSIDDEAAARAYADIWEYVEGYAKARGWPEIIVQPVDEPAWHDEEAKRRNLRLLEILRRLAPHVRTEQDGPGDRYFHELAGPLADVWNYNGGLAPRSTIEKAKAKGKIICIYNCDVEWYRPEVDRYVAGWFQIAAGINGCFNWAYQSFSGDPYDDQDAPMGDHVAYYPPGHGHPGGPSVAWEGFREGVDDYRYVYLLRQLIAEAHNKHSSRARELADEASAEIDRLLSKLKYSPRVRGTARWARYWSEGGKLFISGPLKLPNGWSFAQYDLARRKIADYCSRLSRLLK